MLQYMGTRQPPRKYIVTANGAASSPKDPCNMCTLRTWTPELFTNFRNTPLEQERVSVAHEITAEELRNSVIEGCGFCRTLGDGVHGRVFLDELYERFEKTDSWSGSDTGSGEEASPDVEHGAASQESEDVESEWNDASAFNEEDIDDDVTGGWDAWEDRDTLNQACLFKIELSFERGEAGLCTFANARIEAATEDMDDPNELQKLHGEKAVELRYHINVDSDDTTSMEMLFPKATMNSALGAEFNMQLIEAWKRKLDLDVHTPARNANELPARLIELGAVTSRTVVVKGRIYSFIWHPHTDDAFHNSLDSDGLLATKLDNPTALYSELNGGEPTIDALGSGLSDGVEVTCIATRLMGNVPRRQDVEGLMLLPVNDTAHRRVGFFRLTGPSGLMMYKDRDTQEINIV